MAEKQSTVSSDVRGKHSDALKLGGELTIVRVKTTTASGDETTTFCVHIDLLRDRSTLLNHTTSPFPSTVSLSHGNPAVVEGYLSYLYTGRLPCMGYSSATSIHRSVFSRLVDFYVLGSRFRDTKLMHDAMNAVLITYRNHIGEHGSGRPSTALISHVYEQADADEPLKRLFMDMYLWNSKPSTLGNHENLVLRHDVVCDIAQAALNVLGKHRDLPSLEASSSHNYLISEAEPVTTSADGEDQSKAVSSGSTNTSQVVKKRKRMFS